MKKMLLTTALLAGFVGASVAQAAGYNDQVHKSKYECKLKTKKKNAKYLDRNKIVDVVFFNNDQAHYAVMNVMDELRPFIQVSSTDNAGTIYQDLDKNYSYKLSLKGKDLILSSVDGQGKTKIDQQCQLAN